MENKIILGDCLEKLKELEDNSVDSIITDPPYELGFMGKSWDSTGIANNVDMWKECLRVLKPGAYLLAFSGTRTYHRMASAIEDAGFEVRDMIEWVYGTGFPKSWNIGKAVDKIGGKYVDWQKFQSWLKEYKTKSGYTNKQLDELLGFSTKGGGMFDHFINPAQAQVPRADTYKKIKEILKLDDSFDELIETTERELVGKTITNKTVYQNIGGKNESGEINITKGTSEWEGWGTALKPAHEPICMARKPLAEKTIAENCLKWGTGGINIDESRVEHNEPEKHTKRTAKGFWNNLADQKGLASADPLGRFPANLIHDNSEEVRECFPETKVQVDNRHKGADRSTKFGQIKSNTVKQWYEDNSGNASRFFKSIIYQAKASKKERNKGMDELPVKNNHPTVKPIALLKYLIKMVTPKGGILLDPFAGSGSTLVASKKLGYKYIGIELTEEYIPIIEARLSSIQIKQKSL